MAVSTFPRLSLMALGLAAAMLLPACTGQAPVAPAAPEAAASQPAAPSAPAVGAVAAPAEAPSEPAFDLAAVPLSDAPLGDFPYFTLPEGYANPNRAIPIAELDRIPFWTGDRLEWVEGRVFQTLVHAQRGKAFSKLELERNLGQLVESVGGVQVTHSKIPAAVLDSIDRDVQVNYVGGFGPVHNQPVTTWVVRRPDRAIWIHLAATGSSGGMLVAETRPFVPTAKLLPAGELKQALDASGKVALQVNFATDQALILPESRPQIEQVTALLRQNPELRLAVDGHTDDTGAAGHNRRLSEARAAAVVAALAAEGIDARRLQANGYGPDRPVADNASEQGRAANRRVELVRL